MNSKKITIAKTAISCGLLLIATPVVAQASPWTQQVHSLVRANFSYPRSAQVRGDEGSATIRVDLAADGSITGVTLTKSSGSPILDREAVRIAQKIQRFPTPPRGTTNISLPISWQLK
ncbi:MAG: TonB family protein [Sphingorhabdus sp.]